MSTYPINPKKEHAMTKMFAVLFALALAACGTPMQAPTASITVATTLSSGTTLNGSEANPSVSLKVQGTCLGIDNGSDTDTPVNETIEVAAGASATKALCVGTLSLTASAGQGWKATCPTQITTAQNAPTPVSCVLERKDGTTVVVQPLNLNGKAAACNTAKAELDKAKGELDTALAGFNATPRTTTREALSASIGKVGGTETSVIGSANALEDEITLAIRQGVSDSNADLVAAKAALKAARDSVTAAEISIELARVALDKDSSGTTTVTPNFRVGKVKVCAVDFRNGNTMEVSVKEVAVGVTPEKKGTGCFTYGDLPLNRPLRFRVQDTAGKYDVALAPMNPLVDDIEGNLNVEMIVGIAEGELTMGADPMGLQVNKGGSPLDISLVKVYQKVNGELKAVQATCSHDLMKDVAAVTADCKTLTPGATAGCEKMEASFGGKKVAFEAYNVDPSTGLSGTCQ